MKVWQRDEEVWSIDDILDKDDYVSMLEEFRPHFNNWVFIKKDQDMPIDPGEDIIHYPKWGQHVKHGGGEQGIGDNLFFIKIGELLKYKVVQRLLRKNVELKRVNTNIQFPQQESTMHLDSGHNGWTMLLFVCPYWNPQWGGEFQVQSDDRRMHYVSYNANCGALINGNLLHRGLAPNHISPIERMSIAYTYKEIGNENYDRQASDSRNRNS